jgi:hypothetical protein
MKRVRCVADGDMMTSSYVMFEVQFGEERRTDEADSKVEYCIKVQH